ncbi:hypothetical protein JW948_07170 [bacterium]|nr:hypothetical protein [bacterium]
MEEKKNGFIDYLYVLTKWRKPILTTFFIVCFLAAGFSLIMPKVHQGVVTIMPPMEDSEGLGLSSLMSQIPLGGLGLNGMSDETYAFLAILNSRTIMESVVDTFGLIERYNSDNIEEAVKELRDNVKIDVNEDGTITLKANASTTWLPGKNEEDSTRVCARDMANYFIRELDRVNKELKVERARNTRIFIEKRYLQNINDLAKAEDDFKVFQENYDAIALPEQMSATIQAVSEIQANIIRREIEMKVIEKTMGRSNSEYIRIKSELSEFRNRLNDFRNNKDSSDDLLFTLSEAPDLGLQYARLFRDVVLQEKIMEFLLPQFEQAKINEAKDTPTVQILDEAVVPIKRIRPKRAFFVIFWGILSFIISTSVVFTIESIDRMKLTAPDKHEKFEIIYSTIRNDISKVFKRKHK